MDWSAFQAWLSTTPLWLIAGVLLVAMSAGAVVGRFIRRRFTSDRKAGAEFGDQEGYVLSAALALLGLLLGFTLSLAVDRFDARRGLVLEDANAIGTAYLRSQLLGEPHRTRMSELLVSYTDNLIALAKAPKGPQQTALEERDDTLLTEIWAGSAAAFDSIRDLDFSSSYVESMNRLIDLDASRRASRVARIPVQIFGVLFVYIVASCVELGFVLRARRGAIAAGVLMVLLNMSLMLIVDIDRPALGGILESQRPMEDLRRSLAAQPPRVFDRWRTQPAAAAAPRSSVSGPTAGP